jgi:CBS domain-containing protein
MRSGALAAPNLTKVKQADSSRSSLCRMRVDQIMARDVVSVLPEASVREIASLMLERRISGVPVVDAEGKVLGVVSEGDLIRRPEIETDRTGRGWLSMFVSDEERARDFVKSHGRRAREVMTQPAVCVAPQTALDEAVRIMERHHIKRLPVIEQGRLVGLMTRADLVRALLQRQHVPAPAQSDQELRQHVEALLRSEDWGAGAYINVVVEAGVVQLWGTVDSGAQREAVLLAVSSLDGVKGVQAYLGRSMPG